MPGPAMWRSAAGHHEAARASLSSWAP
jgi:hypothetical protein